jgi:hypothetical protein
MRAAEQPRRELADLTTTSHASAISTTCPDDRGTEIVKALEAAPIGSAITFATDNLGVLCLAGAPIVRGTEAYRKVEHFGQACNCSFSLHEKGGTTHGSPARRARRKRQRARKRIHHLLFSLCRRTKTGRSTARLRRRCTPISGTAGTSGDRGADLNLVRSFAPIRRQRGVARRVFDIAMPQDRLQRTCVDAILCRDDQSDWWTWSIRHNRSIGFITGGSRRDRRRLQQLVHRESHRLGRRYRVPMRQGESMIH